MKQLALACLGALALVMSASAQFWTEVVVDNTAATIAPGQGISDLAVSNYYVGPYGVQVSELSPQPSGAALATLLAGINNAPSGLAGYAAMVADGFKLEGEFDGNTTTGYYIKVGVVYMPDVVPVGSNIILGLAVWNTSTSFTTMLTNSGAHLGVIAFPQATVNANLIGPAIAPDISAGWLSLNGGTGQELVMTPIPEPGRLALLGLGAGVLLAFSWGRQRRPRARVRGR